MQVSIIAIDTAWVNTNIDWTADTALAYRNGWKVVRLFQDGTPLKIAELAMPIDQ